MKGVFLGTLGGAENPLTPPDKAFTPALLKMGMIARVAPGTSLWHSGKMRSNMNYETRVESLISCYDKALKRSATARHEDADSRRDHRVQSFSLRHH